VFAPNAAAFATTRRWETVLAANAIVNNLYVFRVNRVGREQRQDFYGRSVCIDPEGEFLLPPSGMHDGSFSRTSIPPQCARCGRSGASCAPPPRALPGGEGLTGHAPRPTAIVAAGTLAVCLVAALAAF